MQSLSENFKRWCSIGSAEKNFIGISLQRIGVANWSMIHSAATLKSMRRSARATSRITHLGRLLFYWHDSQRTVPNQCASPTTRGGDITAGTGSLIIQKWWNDCIRTDIFDYRPHDYVYIAQEYADNAIPYLLHNLAMRGMNCVVIHGDTLERTAKNIYLVQNAKDDFLAFSSINVMPRSETVANWFGIKSFVDKPIEYIEDTLESVIFRTGGSMDHERFECAEAKVVPYVPEYNAQLKDIATIERAKAKKQYPAGTIVIQMSATRGQTGLLKSTGEVPTHYACIQLKPNFNPEYMHLYLKHRANPRHFHRVQEGLNLTLDNIETIPIVPWVLWLHGEIDLLTQEEYEDFMEHSRF